MGSSLQKQESLLDQITALQKEVNHLKQQLKEKEQKEPEYESDAINEILDEIDEKYEKKEEDEEEEDDKKKTTQFWNDLEKTLKDGDIEHIKDLVRSKELKINEINEKNGRNLLMYAAQYGSYELVSMAINLGADIDKEDKRKQTALKIAITAGFVDIEELLIMNLLKTELGQRIENTTNDIAQKKGITNNFIRILKEIFVKKNNDDNDDDNKQNDNIKETEHD